LYFGFIKLRPARVRVFCVLGSTRISLIKHLFHGPLANLPMRKIFKKQKCQRLAKKNYVDEAHLQK